MYIYIFVIFVVYIYLHICYFCAFQPQTITNLLPIATGGRTYPDNDIHLPLTQIPIHTLCYYHLKTPWMSYPSDTTLLSIPLRWGSQRITRYLWLNLSKLRVSKYIGSITYHFIIMSQVQKNHIIYIYLCIDILLPSILFLLY